jgi:CRISPR/Cas system-associated exonuclease Cas4 (RecB family)
MSILESLHHYFSDLLSDASRADYGIVLLCIIGISAMMVLDAVTLAVARIRKQTGIEHRTKSVVVDGSDLRPGKSYLSERQALAGRPDAVIEESGFLIPVERKPLARKVRDRYVAQLLIYMRLIEEFEGKRPPHGYLILGPKCRRIKIVNSPERQAWVDGMLNEMRAVLSGLPSKPTPHVNKCSRCDVRAHCASAAVPIAAHGSKRSKSTLSVVTQP